MTISWNPRTRICHFFCKDWQLHIKSSSYSHLMKSLHKNPPFLLQQGLQDCHGSIEPRNDVLTERSATALSSLAMTCWLTALIMRFRQFLRTGRSSLSWRPEFGPFSWPTHEILTITWNPRTRIRHFFCKDWQLHIKSSSYDHLMKSSHKNLPFLLQGLAITHKIVVL